MAKTSDREKLINRIYACGSLMQSNDIPLPVRKRFASSAWSVMECLHTSTADRKLVYAHFFGVGEMSDTTPGMTAKIVGL